VPVHDVAVTGLTAPTPVTVGLAQTVTVNVSNQGTLSETFLVSMSDSLGATIGAPQTVTNLAAAGSQALSFAWTPTATGTHTLTATAATVTGETDTADNVGTATSVVNAVAVHDVAVTGVTAPTPVTVGLPQTVTVDVANQGNFTETFLVSMSDSLGATIGAPQTVTNLAAAGSQALSFAWTPTVAGTHTLTATAAAVSGEIDTADNLKTTTVECTASLIPLDVRIATSSDDAEEALAGTVDRGSTDLELIEDKSTQTVGMRFNNVGIPKEATIANAYIQFKVDEKSLIATTLTIRGQAADSAASFSTSAFDISSRPRTAAAVLWSPAAWPTVGAAGTDQRTTDLAAVIQEIVNRPGWLSGSSLAIIITGTGKRVAESYDGDVPGAPLLHVEYASNLTPVHDVAVTGVTAPTPVTLGLAQTIMVNVANQGTFPETFQVTLSDNLGATVGSPQTVTDLAAGRSQALSFSWTPAVTGTHTLTATASTVPEETDTADNAKTAAVETAAGLIPLDIRVNESGDDAEEALSGSVDRGSSDLELVEDKSTQTVGIRFNNVGIPKGATIANAYIQFKVDEKSSIATTLTIRGQAADSAATFSTSALDISSRPRTAAAVLWSPAAWPTVGAAGIAQRTPNLAPVIQEIVDRAGWSEGSSLAIIITGTGKRVAESYNGEAAGAPLLHVEYAMAPAGEATAPTPMMLGQAQYEINVGAPMRAVMTEDDFSYGSIRSLEEGTPLEQGRAAQKAFTPGMLSLSIQKGSRGGSPEDSGSFARTKITVSTGVLPAADVLPAS
jgi:hypothetical protein